MSYQPGADGGTLQCDECGRTSNDPLPVLFNGLHPKTVSWGHLSLLNLNFDVCPVCLRMKFGHLLLLLEKRWSQG